MLPNDKSASSQIQPHLMEMTPAFSHNAEMIGKLISLIHSSFPEVHVELLKQTLIFRLQLTKLLRDTLKARLGDQHPEEPSTPVPQA